MPAVAWQKGNVLNVPVNVWIVRALDCSEVNNHHREPIFTFDAALPLKGERNQLAGNSDRRS